PDQGQHRVHVHYDVCCPSVVIPVLNSGTIEHRIPEAFATLAAQPTQGVAPDNLLRPPIGLSILRPSLCQVYCRWLVRHWLTRWGGEMCKKNRPESVRRLRHFWSSANHIASVVLVITASQILLVNGVSAHEGHDHDTSTPLNLPVAPRVIA